MLATKTAPAWTCAILEPNALTVIITTEGRVREEIDLPIAKLSDAETVERDTHFQPAVLRRREYIFPMSPMPIMPMLLLFSMLTVLHAVLRGCHVGVQPIVGDAK